MSAEPPARPPDAPDAVPLLARLRAAFPDSSTRRLKQWLDAGRVRVNGAVARDGRTPTRAGDAVGLGPAAGPPFPSRLRLVYEDDALLVIDKPAGILTIATEREREQTVHRLLRSYLAGRRPLARPFVVHRLDRDTSGLLVFAKSPAAKAHLQAQFAHRTAERVYVAVVEGRVRDDAGTLASRLVEDRALRVRSRRNDRGRAVGGPAGRVAITHYRVLARGRDVTLLELRLGTGRRHQIRVQLAEMGHPILGDRRHGSARDPARRLCLHATALGFVHPESRASVRFTSPVPDAVRRAGGAR